MRTSFAKPCSETGDQVQDCIIGFGCCRCGVMAWPLRIEYPESVKLFRESVLDVRIRSS